MKVNEAMIAMDVLHSLEKSRTIFGVNIGYRIKEVIRSGFDDCIKYDLDKKMYAKLLIMTDTKYIPHIKAVIVPHWKDAFDICDMIDKIMILK